MSTVLDASFAVNWLLAENGSELDQLLLSAKPRGLLAPVIFWHEAASALRTLCLRSVLAMNERDQALARLKQLGVASDADPPEIDRVVGVADRFNLTVYDAAYLEFASRTGSELATGDAALVQSARKIGVKVLAALA